jgi:hypothetical protein
VDFIELNRIRQERLTLKNYVKKLKYLSERGQEKQDMAMVRRELMEEKTQKERDMRIRRWDFYKQVRDEAIDYFIQQFKMKKKVKCLLVLIFIRKWLTALSVQMEDVRR